MSDTLPIDTVQEGDCVEILHRLPAESVDLIFADPPYNLQLRQELWRPNQTLVDAVNDEWDHFDDFAAYDTFTRDWLAACRRVLKPTGTLWVIGTYHNIFRVGTIMQNLGYWILNDVTWIKCLAGNTELLALINGVPIVTNLKDLIRLDLTANTIQLPSYDEHGCFCWVDIQGWQKNPKSTGLRVRLEDGHWVECTPEHRFPIFQNGRIENIPAKDLKPGDALLELTTFKLPRIIESQGINEEVGEFIGWFLAEGSYLSEEKGIVLSMSSEEQPQAERLIKAIQTCFGVVGRTHIYKKSLHLVFPSRFMIEMVRRFVRGRSAKNKRLSREAFLHGDAFLHGVLMGYLKGDGHWDVKNQRWRLGFARNKGLIIDLSVICTTLGYRIRFHDGFAPYKDSKAEIIRGEIRENKDRRWDFIGIKELGLPSRRYFTDKQQNSVLRFREQYQIITRKSLDGQMTDAGEKMMMGDIRTVRIQSVESGTQRTFYDVAVSGDHIFALANGILTHNSNPMPNFRGVRFTNAHETLIWAQKEAGNSYTFNHHAMKALNEDLQMRSDWFLPICNGKERIRIDGAKAHATQKPEALLYRVILSSSNPGDVVLDPFFGTGTTGVVARKLQRHWIGIERDPQYAWLARKRISEAQPADQPADIYQTYNPRKAKRLPFGALLEYGYLKPGDCLYYGPKGDISARVMADGSLEYGGRRGSIHQIARLLHAGLANGWQLWYYVDEETQQRQPIDRLRQILRESIENQKETNSE